MKIGAIVFEFALAYQRRAARHAHASRISAMLSVEEIGIIVRRLAMTALKKAYAC